MLERSGRPLLIEINANPFLGTQNEWHAALVARAADDFVGLALEESAPDVATELLVGGAAPRSTASRWQRGAAADGSSCLARPRASAAAVHDAAGGARARASALCRRRRRRRIARRRRRRRRRRCARSGGAVASDAEG